MQSEAPYTTKDGEILFNNETAVEAIEMLKQGIDEGYWRVPGEDKYSSGPFLAENVYMYLGSSAGEGFLHRDNFEWNTAVIPQVNVDKPKSPQQGANIAIINQNKTSEEVYGSYEFIKYLVSTEVNTKWAMNTGYLPIRQSVLDSQEYQDYLATVKGNVKVNGTTASKDAFVEALFNNGAVSSSMVRDELNVMLESIILQGEDIQEMLDYYTDRLSH